jgi:hypothetical protein
MMAVPVAVMAGIAVADAVGTSGVAALAVAVSK